MRSVWQGLLCAGLVAGFWGTAAAHEVKIWVPTPMKAEPYKAPVAATDVRVISVVAVQPHRRFTGRDWVLGDRSSGFTRTYSGPLYPF
jgi:hypothetical protein